MPSRHQGLVELFYVWLYNKLWLKKSTACKFGAILSVNLQRLFCCFEVTSSTIVLWQLPGIICFQNGIIKLFCMKEKEFKMEVNVSKAFKMEVNVSEAIPSNSATHMYTNSVFI
jgi:hypothetical protein